MYLIANRPAKALVDGKSGIEFITALDFAVHPIQVTETLTYSSFVKTEDFSKTRSKYKTEH